MFFCHQPIWFKVTKDAFPPIVGEQVMLIKTALDFIRNKWYIPCLDKQAADFHVEHFAAFYLML